MRPGIEILLVAAADSPEGSQLRRICQDVRRLETAFSARPRSADTSQLATLNEFFAYQAISLRPGPDLDALEKMIAEFGRQCAVDGDLETSWRTVRELSRLGRSDDRIGGSAFVLPRAEGPAAALDPAGE